MSEKKELVSSPKPVNYYGKKAYRINPMLVRVKPAPEKTFDFRQDNSDATTQRRPS